MNVSSDGAWIVFVRDISNASYQEILEAMKRPIGDSGHSRTMLSHDSDRDQRRRTQDGIITKEYARVLLLASIKLRQSHAKRN